MQNQPSSSAAAVSERLRAAAANIGPLARKVWQDVRKFFQGVDFLELFALLFVILMVTLFPLSGVRPYYKGIVTHRERIFYMMISVAVGVLIVTSLIRFFLKHSVRSLVNKDFFARAQAVLKRFISSFTLIEAAVLVYLLFVLISALLSEDKKISFYGLPTRSNGFFLQLGYVATFFVISRFLRLHRLDLNLYSYGAAFFSLVLLLHYFGWDLMGTRYKADAIFVGPMGNIDFTSYFTAVAVALTGAIYITEQFAEFDAKGHGSLGCFVLIFWSQLIVNVDSGIAALGVAFLAGLPLLITSFRRLTQLVKLLCAGVGTALLKQTVCVLRHTDTFGKTEILLIVAELVLAGLLIAIRRGLIRWEPSAQLLRRITLSVDGAVIVIGLIAAYYAANHQTSGTLYQFGQILFYANYDGYFGSRRMIIWKCSLKLAGKHLWFGIGPDMFRDVFMANYRDAIYPYYVNTNICEAHNEYLHLLISSGIFALLGFLVFLGGMIVQCCKRAGNEPILGCCAIGVVAYAVHAFFILALPIHTPLMWVMLGLAGAGLRRAVKKPVNVQSAEEGVAEGNSSDEPATEETANA